MKGGSCLCVHGVHGVHAGLSDAVRCFRCWPDCLEYQRMSLKCADLFVVLRSGVPLVILGLLKKSSESDTVEMGDSF